MIDLSKKKGRLKLRKNEEILGTPEGHMANPRTELVNLIKEELLISERNKKQKDKNKWYLSYN